MRFGRLYRGVVVSVTEPSPGRTIEQHVGEDQADNYVALPDHVGVGYIQQLDDTWLSPEQAESRKKEGVKA
jgi:hypothetical protein